MNNNQKRFRITRFAENFSMIVSVGLSVRLLAVVEADRVNYILSSVMFLFVAVSFLFRVLRLPKEDKLACINSGVAAAMYVCAAAIALVFPQRSFTMVICFGLFLVSFLLSRVFSVIKNHKVWNILYNVAVAALMILVMFYLVGLLVEKPELEKYGEEVMAILKDADMLSQLWTIGAVITIMQLIRIIGLSFSRFRVDVLIKVAKKSMAIEILSGLMILIVAFSFVISSVDPNINNVPDAMWYCFAVVTTIGFGDFTASTLLGRALSVVLGIYGIIVVALITSIIVNFYNEIKDEKAPDVETDGEQTDAEVTVKTDGKEQ